MLDKPYLSRFFRNLLSEMGAFVSGQQLLSAAALALLAFVYQYRAGRLTLEALKENVASVIFPFIWVVCGFGCFYVVKAAIRLHKERLSEVAAYKPSIVGYSPKRPSWIPEALSAAVMVGLFGLLSYGAFIVARPTSGKLVPDPPIKISDTKSTAVLEPTGKKEEQVYPSPNGGSQGKVQPNSREMPDVPGELSVSCPTPKSESECELKCMVHNGLPKAVRDVSVGFISLLPASTRLSADTEWRAKLEKSETLPIPDPDGIMKDARAFDIVIPLIPPHTEAEFSLQTSDPDNIRACREASGIRQLMKQALEVLISRHENAGQLDAEAALRQFPRALFRPKEALFDSGRVAIATGTAADKAKFSETWKIANATPKDELDALIVRECYAPVFVIETDGNGKTTFAAMPPAVGMRGYILSRITIPPPGQRVNLNMRPTPPISYDCDMP